MAKINRFEDLQSWQKARALANYIYDLTETPKFSKDFRLRDQIQGAAGSVMHNIAEGFDSGSDAEFKRFLIYSMRSVTETQSQLYTALDRSYIKSEQFEELYLQAEKIKNDIRKFISYLSQSKKLGVGEIRPVYLSNDQEFQAMPGDGEDSGLRTLDIEKRGEK